jgi:hypothetical protein
MNEKQSDTNYLTRLFIAPLLVILALVWILLIGVAYPFRFGYEQWLKSRFWHRHGRHGRFVLLIYSESPNWKPYIESKILPRLGSRVVTLNWSARKEWRRNNRFEARLFNHWAGDNEFNPMALVFDPIGRVKDVRFWQAFRDFKHGKDRLLKQAENVLFSEVERIVSKSA